MKDKSMRKDMRMNNKFRVGLAGIFLLSLVGCGLTSDYESANVDWIKSQEKSFNPQSASSLPANATNLVFFRNDAGASKDTAVNIAINNRFQTSLRGGNYSAVPSCAGSTKISTAITKKLLNDLSFNPNIYEFEPRKNNYFEVSVDDQGSSKITKVDENVAIKQLSGKSLQTHLVNRTSLKDCKNFVVRKDDPVPVKKDNLFGVYYFGFNSSSLNAAEEQRVYNMGTKISELKQSYKVYLSGHADPVGSDGDNKALSRRRTIAVAQTLEKAGVKASAIKMGSFGESQPVMLTCEGIKTSATRNGCNLKNRRVELTVKMDEGM